MKADIHCGACGEVFLTPVQLSYHLSHCKAAEILRPLVLMVNICGQDYYGHPVAWIIRQVPRVTSLIGQYAASVAYEMDHMRRVELHSKLCEALEIPHSEFKPFEDTAIKDLPTVDQAIDMIYYAISEWAFSLMRKKRYKDES